MSTQKHILTRTHVHARTNHWRARLFAARVCVTDDCLVIVKICYIRLMFDFKLSRIHKHHCTYTHKNTHTILQKHVHVYLIYIRKSPLYIYMYIYMHAYIYICI